VRAGSRFVRAHRPVHGERQEVKRSTASGAGGQRELGGRAAESSGRRQHRRRPDIILGTNDDANLYPDKLVDVTDLANYLGKKYGGFYPACEAYLRPDGKRWIGIPLGAAGSMMVYRRACSRPRASTAFRRTPTLSSR